MLALIDAPCRPERYNCLPGIFEADSAIKSLQRPLDQLIELGSEACSATPFARGEVGAFLLHKHWDIREGECMIEHASVYPLSDKPALITSARPLSSRSTVAPSRFKVDTMRQELVALEFSSDQFVLHAWQVIAENPKFLENVCRLICECGLAEQIGFAIFDRTTVKLAEGEQMVEENWKERSVLSAQVLSDDEKSFVIRTGWPFFSVSQASSCIAYCMTAGSSPHCRHHSGHPAE